MLESKFGMRSMLGHNKIELPLWAYDAILEASHVRTAIGRQDLNETM
jgi:hypothetical protein